MNKLKQVEIQGNIKESLKRDDGFYKVTINEKVRFCGTPGFKATFDSLVKIPIDFILCLEEFTIVSTNVDSQVQLEKIEMNVDIIEQEINN